LNHSGGDIFWFSSAAAKCYISTTTFVIEEQLKKVLVLSATIFSGPFNKI